MLGNEFLINVDGIPRRLFRVEERSKTGDLTIKLRPGVHATEELSYDDIKPDSEIKEYRFSVHASPDNDEYSLINFTQVVGTRKKENKRHFTSVTKRAGMLAPIFYRRANWLKGPYYDFEAGKKYLPKVSLGEFDLKAFQLVFGVYVAQEGVHVFWTRRGTVNAAHAAYSKFRIVVLWSFLGTPSDSTSDVSVIDNSYPVLEKLPEEIRKHVEIMSHGIFPYELQDDFRLHRERLRKLYSEKATATMPENKESLRRLNETLWGPFFQKGRCDTLEYAAETHRRAELIPTLQNELTLVQQTLTKYPPLKADKA